jgi:hypothetical protein
MSNPAYSLKQGATDKQPAAMPVKVTQKQGEHLPTYHADGGWGISNHHGMIRIAFYTENPPIPESIIQHVHPDGKPKGSPEIAGPDVSEYHIVVRDFQCNVILPLSAAVQVHGMLGNFIKVVQEEAAERALGQSKEPGVGEVFRDKLGK